MMRFGRDVPDEELVRLVLQGRSERYADLVKRYERLVYSVLLARVSRSEDLEDLAQETFFRAFRHLDALDTPSCFGAWLRRIADHVALNHQRSQGVRELISTDLLSFPPRDEPTDRAALVEELHDRVWAAIGRLPLDQREVVLLYYMEERTCGEIALFVNATASAVKGRLRRARTQLRVALGDLSHEAGYAGQYGFRRRRGNR